MPPTSLWTGPREDPRRYRVDLVDGEPVSIGGGEGLVYRAVILEGGAEREVALKMHTSLGVADFEQDLTRANALASVEHPNLMRLIEAFVGPALVDNHDLSDDAFSIMYTAAEWVPGLSFATALETASPNAGLEWVAQVARAVEALHTFRSDETPDGIVHRDIKPSNVRVTPEGQAVLIDYGIARPHAEGDLTEGAGTYLWRAPEVLGGPGEPGPASDAWGVGALAYWVLTGSSPPLEGIASIREALIVAARAAHICDPRGISHCVATLLEPHPEDRPIDLARWADRFSHRLSTPGRAFRHLSRRLIDTRQKGALIGSLAATSLLIALTIVLLVSPMSVFGPRKSPSAAPSPPTGKQLLRFIPSDYLVTKESSIRLTQSGPPLTVVTDQEELNNSDGAPEDLLLLSWDRFAHRWLKVFDGADAPTPDPVFSAFLPQGIGNQSANINGLAYRTIAAAPRRRDLVFWAFDSPGANGELDVGIIHWNGQTASVVYSTSLLDGSVAPIVAGVAPHQSLHLSAPWIDQADALGDPIRNFNQVVAWEPNPPGDGPGSSYQVISDTRSWLGVYTIDKPGIPVTLSSPQLVVAVAPGSPADGVLQFGDELLSVEGVSVPNDNIFDEVASQQPGTRISLSIVRAGTLMSVELKLSSYGASSIYPLISEPEYGGTSAGYTGLEVATDTPSLASADGLGTTSGAVVMKIEPGSPAASTDLQVGDVITSFDNETVTSAGDLTIDEVQVGTDPDSNVPSYLTYIDHSGQSHNLQLTLSAMNGL